MDSLLELFCDVDDFCEEFKPELDKKMLQSGKIHRNRERNMTVSEMMTLLIGECPELCVNGIPYNG